MEERSINHCCHEKAVTTSYCGCVFVASVSQHEKRMRRVTVCSVACPALLNFSTLSHKQKDFRQGVTEHKMWVLIFPTISETFFILRITQRDIVTNVHVLYLKYPSFLAYFNEIWIFSTDFRKILKRQFHKSPSSRSRVVLCRPTDERIDRQKKIRKNQ